MNELSLFKKFELVKKNKDALNCDYLSKDDYEVCDYVVNNIVNYRFSTIKDHIISKRKTLLKSLIEFKNFSSDNFSNLLEIVNNAKIISDCMVHHTFVEVSFDISDDINKTISDGFFNGYHIPIITRSIDIIGLGHEHCHALKETNYLEHKNGLVCGEIIPIFYELINYENDSLRREYLKFRLSWLAKRKLDYKLFCEAFKNIDSNDEESKNMSLFVKSYYGSYITGFYYALILYDLYKRNPNKILGLVSDVLKHSITTMEALQSLGIYCDVKGEVFEKEIRQMNKILKL